MDTVVDTNGQATQDVPKSSTYLWQLDDVKQQLEAGKTVSVTTREMLTWFGYTRRGRLVVKEIRKELHKRGVQTIPDFEYAWIDGPITFVQPGAKSPGATSPARAETADHAGQPSGEDGNGVVPGGTAAMAYSDPTYRIGKLPFANRPPVNVHPDRDLTEAITLMMKDDFSQLPVMTTEREVRGLISWKHIALGKQVGKLGGKVSDHMGDPPEIVRNDVSLFRVIDAIVRDECVLVRDETRKITGIVTASDLSDTLHQLGVPFLLLGEIENLIRSLIDGKFTPTELKKSCSAENAAPDIEDVSDLTFGGYVQLIQEPSRWDKLGLKVDRVTFVKALEQVNKIRNDVMHFDPEGITPEELEELRQAARFLQDVRAMHGIQQ